MIVMALAQIQTGFNVICGSIGGLFEDFDTSPAASAAALVLLAGGGRVRHAGRQARQGDRLPGWRFRSGADLVWVGDWAARRSERAPKIMIGMQVIAGSAAAILVPTLVAVAYHYTGGQQSHPWVYLAQHLWCWRSSLSASWAPCFRGGTVSLDHPHRCGGSLAELQIE